MNEEDMPELTEAVRRLSEEEQNLRMFRIKRALDLSMKHQLLPKEEWTKPEEVMARILGEKVKCFTCSTKKK